MNAVENKVRELVNVELTAANADNLQFHSPHEGWAVILEEINELKFNVKWVKKYQKLLFVDIMKNSGRVSRCGSAELIKKYAINAACEAIQVAAMAQKYLDMEANGDAH